MDLHLARGYRFAGIHCGLRPDPDRRDLALVASERLASAAGMFTQNRVVAAPVRVCQERLPSEAIRGFVVCSGNANACTGAQGLMDARRMAALAAEAVGCPAEQMLVASTGVIGRLLPMPCFETGIPKAAQALAGSATAFHAATQAILTTDTVSKWVSQRVPLAGGTVTLTGFAKGAAMIGPNLATMLAFLVTDAQAPAAILQATLAHAVRHSFNCISVEGHTSTNDTVFLLANGASGVPVSEADRPRFADAVNDLCRELARKMAADAEGARHLVTLEVEGLLSDEDAHQIAKTIANSALVKTAIYGADPNWGRFVSAAGYAGVPFREQDLSLWLGDLLLYREGAPVPFDAATASAYLKHNREVSMRLRFTLGSGRCTFYTCDLTPDYVHLNSDYTT